MQLVAYGAQDIYLTGSPSITFWKIVYRRHTQFALESIEQTFNGSVDYGKRVTATISRNGDLVSTMWLEITLKKKSTPATYYPAEQFVKDIELEIGGQRIDKVYSDWYRIYDELFRTGDESLAYRRMVDFDTQTANTDTGLIKRFYLPMIFFFNKHPGLALPLIALQYHEVKLNFNFATSTEMSTAGIDTSYTPTATLYATYVFLDTDERRRYAQTSHEYLITQLQHTGAETIAPASTSRTTNVRLNFNHPTKYLTWVVKNANGHNHGAFTVGSATQGAADKDNNAANGQGLTDDRFAVVQEVKLQLNGHDRFSPRKGSYFNQVQPFEHLKANPSAGIYLYSFCLRPEEHQPTGSCNFSRIDNATMVITTKACASTGDVAANLNSETAGAANAIGNLTNLLIFAENFNVLRVMSGMGGLAYSN